MTDINGIIKTAALATALTLILHPSVIAASEVDFVFIPGTDVQVDGPTHAFRISRFEIRNDQFVEFLNDAKLNPDNERGRFMFFDTLTGDVYVHSQQTGSAGTDPDPLTTLMFSASLSGQIEILADVYQVVTTPTDFSSHPVTGVSWYGAVKYCNWLTMDTGLAPSDRAYTESGSDDLIGWHPVTIAREDWATRDLTDAERLALLEVLGYRLPMDGGDAAANPSLYNEWFKVASRKPDDVSGLPIFGADYGFGRDLLGDPDANYRCSGDPFEDPLECISGGTTPVGFYDGLNTLADGTSTQSTDNGYNLFDLSGNVWEWMQDQGFDPNDRQNRGGSFRSSSQSLLLPSRAVRLADAVSDATGLRVVQSVAHDLLVTPNAELTNTGPWGGPYDTEQPTAITYRAQNVTDHDVTLALDVSATWLTVSNVPPTDILILPYGYVDAAVSLTPTCDGTLTLGENTTSIRFENTAEGTSVVRTARLTVTEPLTVSPNVTFDVAEFFGRPTPTRVYTLTSESELPVNYTVAWTDTSDPPQPLGWLLLNGDPDDATGTVSPLGTGELAVSFDTSLMDAGTYAADVNFTDDCTLEAFVRPVRIIVKPTFSVTPAEDVQSAGVIRGPFTPDHLFTLTNLSGGRITWVASATPISPETESDWLDLTPPVGALLARGDTVDILASVNALADSKPVGTYELIIEFRHLQTGFKVQRKLTLDITEVVVDPPGDVTFTGLLGGPFDPTSTVYTIRNTSLSEMPWRVDFTETTVPPSGQAWLTISPASGVILNPTGEMDITVSPSVQAARLDTSTYTATLTFRSKLTGATTQRLVTLIIGDEGFALDMVSIPADHLQPSGPDYLYRVGRYEVTNSDFVRFLNDTLENSTEPRAAYLDHDTTAKTLRLTGDATLLFDAAVGGAIDFVDGAYIIQSGKKLLPVVGVSWYGAVKYCNWMTLNQQMDSPDQRIYTEGPTAGDFDSLDPPDQVVARRGFRLLMDGDSSTAAAYNEWYKAAAWNDGTESNAAYGFGRDTLADADANFRESGDPNEPGLTAVGFYNGVNALADGITLTNLNGNAYSLFDMTGNVAEWSHNVGRVGTERAIRGGHFDSASASSSLRNDTRGSLPATATLSFVGFRVSQTIEPVDLTMSLADGESSRINGMVGGPYTFPGGVADRTAFTLQVENAGTQTVDGLTITISPAWLEVDGIAPRQIPPATRVDIPLRVADAATAAGISPEPSGDFALVPGTDLQTDGPVHDFWVGRAEVTNTEFAAFLRDARANADSATPDVRSHYLYYDLASGSLCINDKQAGEEGKSRSCAGSSTLLYDASVGRIQFVDDDDDYAIDIGFENHPVVGVTWYGAVKYCNWLSTTQGIPTPLRAYEEAAAPNVGGWHPVVVDDVTWSSGSMSPTARKLLIEDTLGYRLPMDDEAAAAAVYSEWFKAASRKDVDSQGLPVFGATYGFGRDDPLGAVDANYFASGDTENDQTTPVKFFNATSTLYTEPVTDCLAPTPEPAVTKDTDNGYGLYDLCGNVAEWTQEFGIDAPHDRALRGGSFRDDVTSPNLLNIGRTLLAPGAATDDVGFRVVRGTGHIITVVVADNLGGAGQTRHLLLDLREPFDVQPLSGIAETGLYGDDFSGRSHSFTLTNPSDAEMGWTVTMDQTWIDVQGPVTGESTGTLTGGASITLDVTTEDSVNDLATGTHEAVVLFTNTTTGESQSRTLDLTIGQPVSVTPDGDATMAFDGLWGGPFATPLSHTLHLTSDVTFPLAYTISADRTWLTLDPPSALSGTLDPDGSIDVTATIDETADALDVGDYNVILAFVWTDPDDESQTATISRTVALNVTDPVTIAQPQEPWAIGPDLDLLPSQNYTLSNTATYPVEVDVSVDAGWLDVDAPVVVLLPGVGQEQIVNVNVNANARTLFDGEYRAALTIENASAGILQCRNIVLMIGETMSVDPFDDFIAHGVLGGPIQPQGTAYRLINVARDAGGPIDWQVTVTTPGVDWLWMNRQRASDGPLSGTLIDGEATTVILSIDTAATSTLSPGLHDVTIEFSDLTNQETAVRTVSLSVVDPLVTLRESLVPSSARQPGGPSYTYNMARYPVTNADYAAFLNDALAGPGNERGAYLYFDTDSGDVYLNTAAIGTTGVDGTGTFVFNATVNPHVSYDATLGTYVVAVGREDHPVTGVSWYGATKFANWLTLDQGLPTTQRCYQESDSTDLDGWRPVSIWERNWVVRDLADTERISLIDKFGFRLPMDAGSDNDPVSSDEADAYNEWYKAAAWDDVAGLNRLYAFGRDTIGGADANFRDSGDPMDNDTTPVGYFDGTLKGTTFATNGNNNGFGLFDMAGNVFEWMQGRFNNSASGLSFRAARGGSWDDAVNSPDLLAVSRNLAPASVCDSRIGFRVVRVPEVPDGDINRDGVIDRKDVGALPNCLTGPQPSALSGLLAGCKPLDLYEDGAIDLHDVSKLQTAFVGP